MGGGLSLCRPPPHCWWGGEGIFPFPSLAYIPQKLGLAPAACDGVWLCSTGQLRSWPIDLNSRGIRGRNAQVNPRWGGAGHVSAEQMGVSGFNSDLPPPTQIRNSRHLLEVRKH